VETLGDVFVTCEAPHADDLPGAVGLGLGEGGDGLEVVLLEDIDGAEEGADVIAARDLAPGL
jgi:hypothetical protein